MMEIRAEFSPFNGKLWFGSHVQSHYYAFYEDPDNQLNNVEVTINYDDKRNEMSTSVALNMVECSLEFTEYKKLPKVRDYMAAARKAVRRFNKKFSETVGAVIVPRFHKEEE